MNNWHFCIVVKFTDFVIIIGLDFKLFHLPTRMMKVSMCLWGLVSVAAIRAVVRFLFYAIVPLILICLGIYLLNQDEVKPVLFYKNSNFTNLNNNDSWKDFKENLNISEYNARIGNFQLIIEDNKKIYSVQFDIIDHSEGKITHYWYRNCYSCKHREENKPVITKFERKDSNEYYKFMDANTFFAKLDLLKKEGFFANTHFPYNIIVSQGTNESIAYPGEYFLLLDHQLKKLDQSNASYSGYYLQAIGNHNPDGFETTEQTTRNVFISHFKMKSE